MSLQKGRKAKALHTDGPPDGRPDGHTLFYSRFVVTKNLTRISGSRTSHMRMHVYILGEGDPLARRNNLPVLVEVELSKDVVISLDRLPALLELKSIEPSVAS